MNKATSCFILCATLLSVNAKADLLTLVRIGPGAFSGIDPIGDENLMPNSFSEYSLDHTFGPSSFSATARAFASYGLLRVYSSATLTAYPGQSYYIPQGPGCDPPFDFCLNTSDYPASALARFSDFVTFSGGSGAGMMRLHVAASGSLSASHNLNIPNGGLDSTAEALVSVFSGASFIGATYLQGIPESMTFDIPFTYGVPVNFQVSALSQIFVMDAYHTPAQPYNFTGTSNYYNTMVLNAIQVTSGSPGTTMTSQSGTAYNLIVPAAIPEPGTWTAFGGLAICAILSAARRAKRPRP